MDFTFLNVCKIPSLTCIFHSTLYFVPMLPLGQGTFQQTLPDLGCCRAGGGWDLAPVYCAYCSMDLSFKKCTPNSIIPFHGFLYLTNLT